MKTIINQTNGYKKEIPEGFSFTTLFFGTFIPLFRGDFKYTVLMVISDILIPIGVGLFLRFFWAFTYNDKYLKHFYENGWVDEKNN